MKCAICGETFVVPKRVGPGAELAQMQFYESLCEAHARGFLNENEGVPTLTLHGEVTLALLDELTQLASVAADARKHIVRLL